MDGNLGSLIVQVHGNWQLENKLNMYKDSKTLKEWLGCYNRFHIHGWSKRLKPGAKNGTRKVWQIQVLEVKLWDLGWK